MLIKKITETYLAKLDCDLEQSPTVMVGDKKEHQQLGKNREISKPSWALVKTKKNKR